MIVMKSNTLKLFYLISNYRKLIWINRNEGRFERKLHSLNIYYIEHLKLIYSISN